jgi:hypothetical protein
LLYLLQGLFRNLPSGTLYIQPTYQWQPNFLLTRRWLVFDLLPFLLLVMPSRVSVPNLIIIWHPLHILFALESLGNSLFAACYAFYLSCSRWGADIYLFEISAYDISNYVESTFTEELDLSFSSPGKYIL